MSYPCLPLPLLSGTKPPNLGIIGGTIGIVVLGKAIDGVTIGDTFKDGVINGVWTGVVATIGFAFGIENAEGCVRGKMSDIGFSFCVVAGFDGVVTGFEMEIGDILKVGVIFISGIDACLNDGFWTAKITVVEVVKDLESWILKTCFDAALLIVGTATSASVGADLKNDLGIVVVIVDFLVNIVSLPPLDGKLAFGVMDGVRGKPFIFIVGGGCLPPKNDFVKSPTFTCGMVANFPSNGYSMLTFLPDSVFRIFLKKILSLPFTGLTLPVSKSNMNFLVGLPVIVNTNVPSGPFAPSAAYNRDSLYMGPTATHRAVDMTNNLLSSVGKLGSMNALTVCGWYEQCGVHQAARVTWHN